MDPLLLLLPPPLRLFPVPRLALPPSAPLLLAPLPPLLLPLPLLLLLLDLFRTARTKPTNGARVGVSWMWLGLAVLKPVWTGRPVKERPHLVR